MSSLNLPKFQKKGFPRFLFPDLPCPRDKKNWAFPDFRSSIYHACRAFLGQFLSSPEGIPQLNSPFYHPTIPRSSSPNYRHPSSKISFMFHLLGIISNRIWTRLVNVKYVASIQYLSVWLLFLIIKNFFLIPPNFFKYPIFGPDFKWFIVKILVKK